MRFTFAVLFVVVLSLSLLWACSADSGGAAGAVESYNQALVGKNTKRLSTLSCAAWEADALNELASFAAVKVMLENMQCSETDQDGDTTLVSCSGKIIANYGNEVLEINLEEMTYQVVLEGGEWRMCGYR
jgi:hypothetical protein